MGGCEEGVGGSGVWEVVTGQCGFSRAPRKMVTLSSLPVFTAALIVCVCVCVCVRVCDGDCEIIFMKELSGFISIQVSYFNNVAMAILCQHATTD